MFVLSRRLRAVLLFALITLLASAVAVVQQAGATQDLPSCFVGTLTNEGTTSVSISSDNTTATAIVSGWAFCQETTQVTYSWNTGATTQSIPVSPGQCVSVTTQIGSDSNGLAWTQTASACAAYSPPPSPTPTPTPVPTCDAPNITNIDSDSDGIDNACDPTPFPDYNVTVSTPMLISSYEFSGPLAADTVVRYTTVIQNCPSGARLKTRVYRSRFGQNIPFVSDPVVAWQDVAYQVCYIPNGSIIWAKAFPPVGEWSLVPWTWTDTSDSGYPFQIVTSTYIRFQWEGTLAICAFHFACGGSKHLGTILWFRPNGMETVGGYVG